MGDHTESARQEYDRIAADYDARWHPYIAATLQAVLEAVEISGREKILDVPCGTGELERRLISRWPALDITGVDLSLAMLQQARSKVVANSIVWIEADVAKLPLPDEAFDLVICANSFHYFPFPMKALREFRRLLRPGGTLILVDWCDDYLMCKLCSLWLRWTDPAFHRAYSLSACRGLLCEAGFQLDSAHRFRIDWLWGLMRLCCRRPG